MGADQAVVILWHVSLAPIEQPNLVCVLLVPMGQNRALTPHHVGMFIAMVPMPMEIPIATRILMGMLTAAVFLLMSIAMMPMPMEIPIATRILMGMLTAAVFLLLLAHSNQHLHADREPQR